MKYAIIAAGEGSRLAEEGINVPKPLVEIGGECLIDRLIRIFSQNDAEGIYVICRAPEGTDSKMQMVDEHLKNIEANGLNGVRVPLHHIVKATPSSMHSFYELSRFLGDAPFVMTTVDTIFREDEFTEYIKTFSTTDCDGMMGVTDYIDDEKPLYVATAASEDNGISDITGFLDADPEKRCTYISGGIYGLKPVALKTLQRCMNSGQSRMRNFQRGLIDDNNNLKAFAFTKVMDIDHASDIDKAENFLRDTQNS